MNKTLSTVFLVLLLIVTIYMSYVFSTKNLVLYDMNGDPFTQNIDNIFNQIKSKEEEKVYTILLAGDVMLARGTESRLIKYGNGDFTFPWKLISETTNKADIFFFNHEGPMSELGTDSGKAYSFNFDTRATEGMIYAGTDVVSLANNHALDWGSEALCDTIKNLSEKSIAQVGAGCNKAEADKPFIKDLGDTRIALIAFTEFYSGNYATEDRIGLTRFDEEELKSKIKKLKEEDMVDIVFVSVHWGEEYETRSNSIQQSLAKSLVDAGADVIVGHHPHVVQEVEKYGDAWIIYSLGNFIFDQYQTGTKEGLLANVLISNKEIQNIELIPIGINEYSQPFIK